MKPNLPSLLAGTAIFTAGLVALVGSPDPVSADGPKPTGPSTTAAKKTPGKIPTKKSSKTKNVDGNARRTLYCRGPFAIVSRSRELLVQAKAVTTKKGAGLHGVHLESGECGWGGTAYNASKAKVQIYPHHYDGNEGVIIACAHDPDCILQLDAMFEGANGLSVSATDNIERLLTYPKGFVWDTDGPMF